jgi:hypothetical protein
MEDTDSECQRGATVSLKPPSSTTYRCTTVRMRKYEVHTMHEGSSTSSEQEAESDPY